MTTPKAEEDVEQKGLLFFAVTMQNDAATVGDSSVVSYETKYSLAVGSSTCIRALGKCCCCCCCVASVMSDSVRLHRWQPTRLPHPWDSPGKNTGVGCHFLLQCMKVKSESEVSQSCLTLSNPMDCSPPGSSVHGIFQARVLEWGAIAFSMEKG